MKEKLTKWYIEEKLSQRQIAEKLGCSQIKVRLLMAECGVRPRSYSESQKVNKKNPWKNKTDEHKKNISIALKGNKNCLGRKLSEKTKRKISESQIKTGQSKNAREYKKLADKLFDGKCLKCTTTKNLCVHHKDGNHYNNKPENLELLCRSCHVSLHRNQA